MTPRPSRPCADSIIDTDKVIAGVDGVVSIGITSYEFTMNEQTSITALMMSA